MLGRVTLSFLLMMAGSDQPPGIGLVFTTCTAVTVRRRTILKFQVNVYSVLKS